MAIRVIVRVVNAADSVHVGGPLEEEYRTFDVDAPELETFMRGQPPAYVTKSFVGVELLSPTRKETT